MTNVDPPLVKAWQSGSGGLFLSKFAPDGNTLLFSTRFGSSQGLSESFPTGDALTGMVIGKDGTVFLVGETQSQDFPFTVDSPQFPVLPDGYVDGFYYMFATAIDPTLSKVIYSDYLGGGYTIALAAGTRNNHLYVTGTCVLGCVPLRNALVTDVPTYGFYTELNRGGKPITVPEFGGDFYPDSPTTIAVEEPGKIYLAGSGTPLFGSIVTIPQFGFPGQSDPIVVGGGIGGSAGIPVSIISRKNRPQISLNSEPPFLTLRNAGSADLHISNITLSGGLTKVWGSCGSTVPAATSCILTVSDGQGSIAGGEVTITSDADPSIQTFPVHSPYGGRTGPPIGDQLWSPNPHQVYEFPPQFEGTATASIPFVIWNVGTMNATLNSINALGSLSETDDCGIQSSVGATLAPGSSCTLQLSIISGGSEPGLAIIYDGTRVEHGSFFVTTPTADQLTLSANALNFATQQVNGIAVPRVVVATNTGDTTLPEPSVSIEGDPEFLIENNRCVSSLAPHQSCVVSIRFNPTNNGGPAATLTISGQQVALYGQGQDGSLVNVSPLDLNFESLAIGETLALPVTLTNVTGSPIDITATSISLSDFSMRDNCGGQVPANSACTVLVAFSPQLRGRRDGYMTIAFSNGANTQVIALKGTGARCVTRQPDSPGDDWWGCEANREHSPTDSN